MTSQFAVLSKIGKKSKNQNLLSGDLTAVVHLCAVAIYTLVLLCNCVARIAFIAYQNKFLGPATVESS